MNSMRIKEKNGGIWWIALSLALVAVLLFTGDGPWGAQAAPGGNPPVFEDSFAVSSVWPGQDWHIFVKGSQSEGQMDYIWVVVSQLGGNMWYNELVRLKGNEQKNFEGYITLPIPRFFPKRSWEYVTVEMRIKDKAGRYSEKRVHELEIGSSTKEVLPAEWQSAAHRELGTLFFRFDLDQADSAGMKER
jgi:hypothetical protein